MSLDALESYISPRKRTGWRNPPHDGPLDGEVITYKATPEQMAEWVARHEGREALPVSNTLREEPSITPPPLPPKPASAPPERRLKPVPSYAGVFAVYSIEDGGIVMRGLPDPEQEVFDAAQLREFAAELIEMAGVFEAASV